MRTTLDKSTSIENVPYLMIGSGHETKHTLSHQGLFTPSQSRLGTTDRESSSLAGKTFARKTGRSGNKCG